MAPALCFWARHQSMAALSVWPGPRTSSPALYWYSSSRANTGCPRARGDGLGTCPSTSTGLLAVANPQLREQGVAKLLGLAQAHQLLALAGGEPPGRHADDEQHEQGEQVAVVGDAQGEVGAVNSRLWPTEPQHGRQDGGHQAGGQGRGENPSTNSSGRGGRQPVREPQAMAEVVPMISQGQQALADLPWACRVAASGWLCLLPYPTSVISNPCACFSRCCTRAAPGRAVGLAEQQL